MKRCIGLIVLLAAILFSSIVMAGEYVVKKGDTISGIAQKNGVTLVSMKLANPKIKNINLILIGQEISLPEKGVQRQARQASDVNAPTPWIPGSNPWKLGKVEGVRRLHFSPEGEKKLIEDVQKNNHFSTAYIYADGKVFDEFGSEYRMVLMGFGKGGFFKPVPAWKDSQYIETGWIYKAESGEYAMFPFKCWNPTRIELVNKIVVAESMPPLQQQPMPEVAQSETSLPPIFKTVEVEKSRIAYRHELDAGGGAYRTSGDTDGAYAFVQYIAYLEQMNRQVAGGTLTPVAGVFTRGSRSENDDTGSGRNNVGIGPQAGFEWNGVTAAGYPQCVQFMIRAIYDYTHGYNDSKGYSNEQQHALIGYYFEYLRRFHPEWLYIIYSEGWLDVAGSFNSTWSGDSLDDLTKVSIGAKLHRDISEDWAVRLGAQLGFQPQEDRLGAAVYVEARYDNWLIFGPRFDYNLMSDIPAEVGGYAYGGFARVELRDSIIENDSKTQMQEVKPADRQLLQY